MIMMYNVNSVIQNYEVQMYKLKIQNYKLTKLYNNQSITIREYAKQIEEQVLHIENLEYQLRQKDREFNDPIFLRGNEK